MHFFFSFFLVMGFLVALIFVFRFSYIIILSPLSRESVGIFLPLISPHSLLFTYSPDLYTHYIPILFFFVSIDYGISSYYALFLTKQ